MVYTRWKCDRYWAYAPKVMWGDFPQIMIFSSLVIYWVWSHASYTSEESERRHGWWVGYPYQRDPIARRNEDKFKRMIRDNDVDITDPIWTGVNRAALQQ